MMTAEQLFSQLSQLLLLLLLLSLQAPDESDAFKQGADRIGYFWHVDSVHLDVNYTIEGDRNNFCWPPSSTDPFRHHRFSSSVGNSNNANGPMGDYLCDSPSNLVTSALEFMRSKTGDSADFIVWTGNSVPQNPRFPQSERIKTLKRATSLFRLHFPYTTVYPSLGNLDFYPHEEELVLGGSGGGGGGVAVVGVAGMLRTKQKESGDEDEELSEEEEMLDDFGNSTDVPNVNQGPSEARKLLSEVTDMWDSWLPPKAISSLRKGGYYTIELAGTKVRLVSLNMNLWLADPASDAKSREREEWLGNRRRYKKGRRRNSNSRGRKRSTASQSRGQGQGQSVSAEEQWRWLAVVMEDARRKRQNVLLFGHSPPGKFERDHSPGGHHWLEHHNNRRFVQFVRRFQDVIVGMLFGHQHTDTFRVFRDDRGRPISYALISPSISPYKRSVQVGQRSFSTNPAVRLFRYDRTTGEIYDYAQYYLRLDRANAAAAASAPAATTAKNANKAKSALATTTAARWQLQYNLTRFYQLQNQLQRPPQMWSLGAPAALNARTMDGLARRLARNATWFGAYLRHNSVLKSTNGQCDEECRKVHSCAISNVDFDDFRMCATQARALSANFGARLRPSVEFLAISMMLTLLLALLI